jgi:hypothetical protein
VIEPARPRAVPREPEPVLVRPPEPPPQFAKPRPVDQRELVKEPRDERADKDEVPFYRKVIAQTHSEDPGGFGPNWSAVDDYDIPTVLRRQMD